jgi:hypothetical protein
LLVLLPGATMGYRPPKGVRPPQLEGKRTGRPKGSKNHARDWADVEWGYQRRDEASGSPPTGAARLWWYFSYFDPDAVGDFLAAYGRL